MKVWISADSIDCRTGVNGNVASINESDRCGQKLILGWMATELLPWQAAQKGQTSHPPTPARQDAPFRRQGRSDLSFIRGGWDAPTMRSSPTPYFTFKGSLVDPRMRASNEHILIVRVPRAGGRPPGYPAPFFSSLIARRFFDIVWNARQTHRQSRARRYPDYWCC